MSPPPRRARLLLRLQLTTYKATKLQSYKATKLQRDEERVTAFATHGHRVSFRCTYKLQNYKVTKLQSYKVTKVERATKVTELQSYKVTKVDKATYPINQSSVSSQNLQNTKITLSRTWRPRSRRRCGACTTGLVACSL